MNKSVKLRPISVDDLQVFYEQQIEPDAIKMAAFPPRDHTEFMDHWINNILNNDSSIKQTIIYKDQIAGNIVGFNMSGKREVGYWLGKNYWGLGIASQALSLFLKEEKHRPLYAHVAGHNQASIRVLEKCGFKVIATDEDFSNEKGEKIGGFILKLDK